MKRILFLLLLTVSVYGQNPSRFAKIQITGNANSGTATKVNVQEANGEVNTQTINTGFNKNIGLGGSDVVGANTLLNQYSTTPIDWTATAFNSGQVVFFVGKQWISKTVTVAGDVPAASSKWEEITFDALANKTTTVDQTIIDGSTNAVSSNAVFDGLATKFPTPTGLTTNYLPKWNGSGFVDSSWQEFAGGRLSNTGSDDLTNKLQVNGSGRFSGELSTNNSKLVLRDDSIENHSTDSDDASIVFNVLGFNKGSTRFRNVSIFDGKGNPFVFFSGQNKEMIIAGTISASPATTANQVPTWGQVQAIARPYKVYTALLSQSGTDAPTAAVLENTLGGTIVWSRLSAGHYNGTLVSAFTNTKTATFAGGNVGNYTVSTLISYVGTNVIRVATSNGADGILNQTSIEIRVYL